MINGIQVLALIPARGGSKGLVGKNLLKINNKSLVGYAVEGALHSKFVDDIYLSSDSEDILKVGIKYNINLIERPAEFSKDNSSAIDVVKHFISVLDPLKMSSNPFILYLQPTSPLRTSDHIDDAISMISMDIVSDDVCLMSVVEYEITPYKAFVVKDDRLVPLFDEKISNVRRQDLPSAYTPNGAIYLFRVQDFLSRNCFPSNGSIPYIMSSGDSIDIDNIEDFRVVKSILEK